MLQANAFTHYNLNAKAGLCYHHTMDSEGHQQYSIRCSTLNVRFSLSVIGHFIIYSTATHLSLSMSVL